MPSALFTVVAGGIAAVVLVELWRDPGRLANRTFAQRLFVIAPGPVLATLGIITVYAWSWLAAGADSAAIDSLGPTGASFSVVSELILLGTACACFLLLAASIAGLKVHLWRARGSTWRGRWQGAALAAAGLMVTAILGWSVLTQEWRQSHGQSRGTDGQCLRSLLEYGIEKHDTDLLRALVMNPDLPPQDLARIGNLDWAELATWRGGMWAPFRRDYRTVLEIIAAHTNTPLVVLSRLATHRAWRVRYATANNPRTPQSSLVLLLDDEERGVALSAARNPATPPDAIARAASRLLEKATTPESRAHVEELVRRRVGGNETRGGKP